MTFLELVNEAERDLGRTLEPDEMTAARRLQNEPNALAMLLSLCDRPSETTDAELRTVRYEPTRVQIVRKGKPRNVPGVRRIP